MVVGNLGIKAGKYSKSKSKFTLNYFPKVYWSFTVHVRTHLFEFNLALEKENITLFCMLYTNT